MEADGAGNKRQPRKTRNAAGARARSLHEQIKEARSDSRKSRVEFARLVAVILTHWCCDEKIRRLLLRPKPPPPPPGGWIFSSSLHGSLFSSERTLSLTHSSCFAESMVGWGSGGDFGAHFSVRMSLLAMHHPIMAPCLMTRAGRSSRMLSWE